MNKLLVNTYYIWIGILVVIFLLPQYTVASLNDSTIVVDNTVKKEKIKPDSISNAKTSKEKGFDAEISYSASDSMVFYGNGAGMLYGDTHVKYKDMSLTNADHVRIKLDSALIYAYPKIDSTGVMVGKPVFKDSGAEYVSNQIVFNFKTKKGVVKQAVTEQGDGYVISKFTKIVDKTTINMTNGKYTTCDLHDNPHFYLSLSKAKVRPGKNIVAGTSHMVLLDVPIPIGLPYGFFPFNKSYSSGIKVPSFDTDYTRGYGLIGGGYYFALSDYADLDITGDVYTRGTWGINASSKYIKRYKYSGGFSINYREDVTGEEDMPDYVKAKNLSIRWSHTQNQKANPFRSFSASVNFSTSGYNRSNINSYYTPVNAENTKSSSISFSQRFPNNPFSITANLNINQRTKDSTINLTLPNISISMNRIYPFKRKNKVGKSRWYEKISMSYSGTFSNSITTKENLLLKSSFADDWRNGMSHNIPISASFNLLNYITITPSFSYKERWYLNSIKKDWDSKTKKEVITKESGFKRVYDFSGGVSANTTLYGMYIPNRKIFGDKILALRHKLDPSLSFSYRPDFGDPFWGYWDSYTRTTPDPQNKNLTISEQIYYSKFENSLYGSPGRGKVANLSFSLGNNLEMKLNNSNDTTENAKKTKIISLIDNFSISSGYNFAADSMKWNNFSANLRIRIKGYTLNLSGAFDPYLYGLESDGKTPKRINQLRWEHGQFPRFLGTSFSYGYTFSNETFSRSKENKKNQTNDLEKNQSAYEADPNNPNRKSNLENQSQSPKRKRKQKNGYEEFSIPWNLSVNYSVRFGNSGKFDYKKMDYKRKFTHNLGMNGSIKLTPNWNISGTTSYDFTAHKFSYTSFNVTRNLHCWTLTGSFVPFGPYKTYNFRIGVNSSMLSDLKYEKQGNRGNYINNVTWY